MINIQDKQALSDLSVIIQMMSENMRQKISPKFIKFIEENKDMNYESNINKKIPIRNQKLNENTKMLLALIYRDYLCSESIRKELLKKEKIEIENIENEQRKKYEINFEDKKRSKK